MTCIAVILFWIVCAVVAREEEHRLGKSAAASSNLADGS